MAIIVFSMADAAPSGVSHHASFGHGIGPIWLLGDVACIGNESRLMECLALYPGSTNPLRVHNCNDSHDVARVNCRRKLIGSHGIGVIF